MESENQILKETLQHFHSTIARDMPKSHYRTFFTWALSTANPQRDPYMQIIGLVQLCKMTAQLLAEVVETTAWPRVVKAAAEMNVYQIYEIVSDNLAIGLAERAPHDAGFEQRTALLQAFNAIAAGRLQGMARAYVLPDSVETFSSFAQCLVPDKLHAFANSYVAQHDDVTINDLDYSLETTLTANVESCVRLLDSMADSPVYDLLREGLVRRYTSVSRLVRGDIESYDVLLDESTYAILVVPTLAFYIGVLEAENPQLAAATRPQDGGPVTSSILGTALYAAAKIVRLLNDLGTLPLHMEDADFVKLRKNLEQVFIKQPDATLLDAVQAIPELTRITKDLQHSEFNLALYHCRKVTNKTEKLDHFMLDLRSCAKIYQKQLAVLEASTAALGEVLGSTTTSNLINRFVRFHQHLYQYAYDSAQGEYAI